MHLTSKCLTDFFFLTTLESKMGIDKNRKAESELIKFKRYPTLSISTIHDALLLIMVFHK